MFQPGGVLVDRLPHPAPSRVYVWDAGNNRVLGFSHVGACSGGAAAGSSCTENSMCGTGRCASTPGLAADIVLGQPSGFDRSSCNHDNTTAAAASATTLCAIPYPFQISPLEGPRGNAMAVDDAHRLYLVDPVSYTHLDVYKRQIFKCGINVGKMQACIGCW